MSEATDISVSEQVAETVLSLIQAFLKTGYYQAGHPETEKARAGLYEEITALFHEQPEITFIANYSGGQVEVLISGVCDELVVMGQVMLKSMAEMFLPKFVEYFRRAKLSTFSLKAGISQQEFEQFVDLMTDTPWLLDSQEDVRVRFTDELVKRNILHVSTVFQDDLVGMGRSLPWRVEVSLSRLKRDLNVVPLYQGVSDEKLEEIRLSIFREIIRPLRNPEILRDFLVNLDLISLELHDYEHDEVVSNILAYMDAKQRLPVCGLLTEAMTSLRKSFGEQEDVEILVRIEQIREVCRQVARLMVQNGEGDAELFETMIEQKIIEPGDIPDDFKGEVEDLLEMKRFVETPEVVLKEISSASSNDERKKRFLNLLELIPILAHLGHDEPLVRLWGFAERVRGSYVLFGEMGLLERLQEEALVVLRSDDRERIDRFLAAMAQCGQLGMRILCENLDLEDRAVRREVSARLVEIGPDVERMLFEVNELKQGPLYLRKMLVVLSKVGAEGDEVERIFKRCLVHPDAAVRKEAVTGIALLMKGAAEPYILDLANDPDQDVRLRVIVALVSTGLVTGEGVQLLVSLLEEKENLLHEQALQTINLLKPVASAEAFEGPLLGLLHKSRFQKAFQKQENNPKIKIATLQALGWLGAEKSLEVVRSYQEDNSPDLARAAKDAARLIEERCR